jgi:hypothetical protein
MCFFSTKDHMNILPMPTSDVEVIGLQVRQVCSDICGHIGRVSVVDYAFYDEDNSMRVHTVDGIWCNSNLLEVVD